MDKYIMKWLCVDTWMNKEVTLMMMNIEINEWIYNEKIMNGHVNGKTSNEWMSVHKLKDDK